MGAHYELPLHCNNNTYNTQILVMAIFRTTLLIVLGSSIPERKVVLYVYNT